MSNKQKQFLPVHLGLVLDGNRRWAKKQGLMLYEGHKKGYENLKTIATAALKRGIKYVSAYVFSTENWNRSEEEVKYLMNLLLWIAKNEVNLYHENDIKVCFAGSQQRLSKNIIKAMKNAEAKTKNNNGGTLLICLNYGGQQEIADAVKQIIKDGVKPAQITPDLIRQYLYVPDIPPADLIIRTSGEQRLSNFMLWRAAYSELLFVNQYWPAFTESDLDSALEVYSQRQRRFGV